jgi:alkylation response protein AidB-like acyl-CoA dehydrogenase
MEFSVSEDVRAVQELAAQILSEQVDDAALKRFDRGEIRWHEGVWAMLAEAGLVGVALPEDAGGSGLGLAGLCAVLQEQGRHVAALPLLAATVLGAMPLARFGSSAQCDAWLTRAAAGAVILSGPLALSPFEHEPAEVPAVSPAGEDFVLQGALGPVPYGGDADALLVPARDASGALSVFLVARGATGMSFERERGTNLEPFDRILFDGVRVTAADRLGASGDGSCILEWMAGRAATAYGFIQLGVLADALRRTAQHTSERKQFGKPLAGFQAVAHRAADCYIDIEALRSTLWQAVWRLDQGLPAGNAVASAAWWTSEAGHRVSHACQHLHGGTGADVEYPIHRYYLWAQQARLCLGGSERILAGFGSQLVQQSIEIGL